MSSKERLDMLTALRGTVCVCGANKPSMRSHCASCYRSLPPEQQKALYKRFGEGYENAYRDSVETLKENGRIKENNGNE